MSFRICANALCSRAQIIFAVCYFRIFQQSLSVVESIYALDWYRCDRINKKTWLILMHYTQNGSRVQVPFYDIELPTFTKVSTIKDRRRQRFYYSGTYYHASIFFIRIVSHLELSWFNTLNDIEHVYLPLSQVISSICSYIVVLKNVLLK